MKSPIFLLSVFLVAHFSQSYALAKAYEGGDEESYEASDRQKNEDEVEVAANNKNTYSSPRATNSYSARPAPSPSVRPYTTNRSRPADTFRVNIQTERRVVRPVAPPSNPYPAARSPQNGQYMNRNTPIGRDSNRIPVPHKDAFVYRRLDGKQDYLRDSHHNIVRDDNPRKNEILRRQLTKELVLSGASSGRSSSSYGRQNVVINNITVNNNNNRHYTNYSYGSRYNRSTGFLEGYILGSLVAPRPIYYPVRRYDGYYDGCWGWCGDYYYAPPPQYRGSVNVIVDGQLTRVPAGETIVIDQQMEAQRNEKYVSVEMRQGDGLSNEQRAELQKQFKMGGSPVFGDLYKIPEDMNRRLLQDAGEGASRMMAGQKCTLSYHGTLVVEEVYGYGEGAVAKVNYLPAKEPDAESLECPLNSKIEMRASELAGFNSRYLENVRRDMADGDRDEAQESYDSLPNEPISLPPPPLAPSHHWFWRDGQLEDERPAETSTATLFESDKN